jgi:hypothetical protein
MNKTQRLRTLLLAGYFPEELPPPFNTRDFATHRDSIGKEWAAHTQYPKSTYELYSVPRLKRVRRNLSIVNPIGQFYVTKLISDNWVEIRKFLKKSSYAVQVPEIETPDVVRGRLRAISPPDFALVVLRRAEISALHDHALVSDISRFYGTLYTHAIPWALHGKAWCKANLHQPAYINSLGARLDRAVCKCQDNQTIGIPTGPDTSRIVSEVIGVAVDEYLRETLSINKLSAFRHVDDWHIGFDSAGAAEDAIATLATGCRTYELELNADKTRTQNPTSAADAVWAAELRAHKFGFVVSAQRKSLEHYFTRAFEFALQYPDQGVLEFAIKRSKSINVSPTNWRSYETFLLRAARANPTVIPTVIQILVSYNAGGYPLGKERLSKLAHDLINKNAPPAHHAEVAWSMFLAKALKLKLSAAAAKQVSSLESSVCALLALDLEQNGLFSGALDKSLWQQSMNADGLVSSMWLLAYEAGLKGWMTGTPSDFCTSHPFFGALRKKAVSFYDTKKNVLHIKKEKPAKPSSAVAQFLAQMAAKQQATGLSMLYF